MTEDQAVEVTTLIKAATASRVDQSTWNYYIAALRGLDFRLACEAASVGTITWRKFPPWAEFKEIYRAQERLSKPAGEQRQDLPSDEQEYKRGEAAPEWVWIWSWCRLKREPRNYLFFPQQTAAVAPEQTMSTEDYEELRKEWIEAGSPKEKSPLPMAR